MSAELHCPYAGARCVDIVKGYVQREAHGVLIVQGHSMVVCRQFFSLCVCVLGAIILSVRMQRTGFCTACYWAT